MSQNRSQWKRPTDVMRTRRQRKKTSLEAKQGDNSSVDEDGNPSTSNQETTTTRKRRNPFDQSSSSAQSTWTEKENCSTKRDVKGRTDDESDSVKSESGSESKERKLFTLLDKADQILHKSAEKTDEFPSVLHERNSVSVHAVQSVSNLHKTEDSRSQQDRKNDQVSWPASIGALPGKSVPQLHQCEVLPLDWSLKVKLRIVGPSALLSSTLSASVKTRALTDYVQNTKMVTDVSNSVLASLERFCNYWVYPSLPWFPEFPRIVADSKIRKQVPMDIGLNTNVQKALRTRWIDGFTSVYHQLKSGLCPYFYLCCYQFTVLFCGPSVGGHSQIRASITPTTRGIREALHREGVDFTMADKKGGVRKRSTDSDSQSPMDNLHSSQSSGREDTCDDTDDLTDSIFTTDEGASLWLQDFGLNTKDFPTLEPSKVKIQREGYQRVDGRAGSLVYCTGINVHAMFNFLLNFRSCTAITGPQAGVPPTILAPTPFSGATLRSNQIQHTSAKLSKGAVTDDSHIVEINGPLLPHHILNISAVLQERVVQPSDGCVISLNTFQHSIPFNTNNQTDSLRTANVTDSEVTCPSPTMEHQESSPEVGSDSEIIAPSPKKLKTSASRYGSGTRLIGCSLNYMKKHQSSDTPSGVRTHSSSSDIRGTPPGISALDKNKSLENCKKSKDHFSASDESIAMEASFASSSDNTSLLENSVSDRLPAGQGGNLGRFGKQRRNTPVTLNPWDSGLHENVKGQLCVACGVKEGAALREVYCEPDGFAWDS